jgi:hypothetical protein
MSKKNVIALAIALLLGGAASANAAGLGVNVGPVGAGVNLGGNGIGAGVNVGGIGADASLGIAPNLGTPNAFTLPTGYAPVGTDGYIAPGGMMTQSAVVGATTTVATPSINTVTALPAGTQLVTSNCNTGIILPGMIGMPQGLQGCNVAVLANTLPSVASLIGNNPPFVASLPVGGAAPVGERTFARVVKRHIVKRVHKHHAHKRVLKRACHRAMQRTILK